MQNRLVLLPARAPPGRHGEAGAKEEEGGGLRNGRNRPEQPVRLAVDAIGEIEGVGVTVHAADPELNRPKATRSIAAAGVDRDRALERPGYRVEGVDLAFDKAEIADQQVAAKLAETGWSQSDAPGRGELAADDRLQQVPALIENPHGSHSRGSPSLGCEPGGRVGYVDFSGDVLHVERDESECADRGGRRKCAGTEAHRGEGAVEDVDAAGPGLVGGVQLSLSLVNGESGVAGPRRRYLDKGRGARVPGGNRAVQVRKDEVRGTAVPAISHREARGAGVYIADLAGGSLGGSATVGRDIAGGRVDGGHLDHSRRA